MVGCAVSEEAKGAPVALGGVVNLAATGETEPAPPEDAAGSAAITGDSISPQANPRRAWPRPATPRGTRSGTTSAGSGSDRDAAGPEGLRGGCRVRGRGRGTRLLPGGPRLAGCDTRESADDACEPADEAREPADDDDVSSESAPGGGRRNGSQPHTERNGQDADASDEYCSSRDYPRFLKPMSSCQ